MKKRNERLVELADCCICYFSNPKSGTVKTVRMAENKGIPIINLAFQKFDSAKILEEIHWEEYAGFDDLPHCEPSPEFKRKMQERLDGVLVDDSDDYKISAYHKKGAP